MLKALHILYQEWFGEPEHRFRDLTPREKTLFGVLLFAITWGIIIGAAVAVIHLIGWLI